MKDGNVNNFLEHVTYEEVAVRYHGNKYFFHGIQRNPETGLYEFTIDLWDAKDWYVATVYQAAAPTADEVMKRFLDDPVIDGSRFMDLESDMEWIDW